MADKQFAIEYLLEIEKKYEEYFKENNLSILDCVVIIGTRPASVHVMNNNLPFDIRFDIETLFWRS